MIIKKNLNQVLIRKRKYKLKKNFFETFAIPKPKNGFFYVVGMAKRYSQMGTYVYMHNGSEYIYMYVHTHVRGMNN